jgi:hypothetical protein
MLKKKLLEFPNGTIYHPKYSCSRIAHFIPHQKAPSPETDVINQFASRVDQFHSLWHVDLSQWFYGTNFFFNRVPNRFSWSFQFNINAS